MCIRDRIQGTASGFFLPGIIRDLSIAFIGLVSIVLRKPFTIYSSMYFRKWPREWYLLPTVKPAYNQVAILWVIFLGVKGGLQVLFFDNPEVLAVIKLATSNQTTLILLVVSYFIHLGQTIFDFPLLWWRTNKSLQSTCQIVNSHIIDEHLQKNKGFIRR